MSEPTAEYIFECPVCKQMRLTVMTDGSVRCESETVTCCTTGAQATTRCMVRGTVVSHTPGRYRLRVWLNTPFPELTFRRAI